MKLLKMKFDNLLPHTPPPQAISIMTAQHGGEVHITGSSTVARDQMQILSSN